MVKKIEDSLNQGDYVTRSYRFFEQKQERLHMIAKRSSHCELVFALANKPQ